MRYISLLGLRRYYTAASLKIWFVCLRQHTRRTTGCLHLLGTRAPYLQIKALVTSLELIYPLPMLSSITDVQFL